MSEFFEALADPNVLFLRYTLIMGVLASLAFGVVGTYVVARRISYLAGAIAHCVLAGIGAGTYLHVVFGWAWCTPTLGAVVAALASALLIGLVSLYAQQREDTVVMAVWSIGMAVGLLFLAKTPGYINAMGYLFGNILFITKQDLWIVATLDVVVVTIGILWYNKLLAVCFDEEFAQLRNVRVAFYYLLLLCLTALTVVLLASVVGIVMVIALLTLPAAVAGQFARRLWQMMVLAVFFCAAFTTAGLVYSYAHDLPTGPTIIVIAGTVYLGAAVGRRVRYRLHRRSGATSREETQENRVSAGKGPTPLA